MNPRSGINRDLNGKRGDFSKPRIEEWAPWLPAYCLGQATVLPIRLKMLQAGNSTGADYILLIQSP